MSWYAVHTKPGKEWRVHRSLTEIGYETLHLHYAGTVKHARKVVPKLKPYFPRYVFVRIIEGQGFYPVNSNWDVSTIVYGVDGPLAISDDMIEELRGRGDDWGLVGGCSDDMEPARVRYGAATRVKIKDGPLAGLFATILTDEGETLKLLVEMFRGKVEATMLPEAVSASPS